MRQKLARILKWFERHAGWTALVSLAACVFIVRLWWLGDLALWRDGRVCDVGVCLIDAGGDGPPARRCDVVGRSGRCELTPGSRVETLAAAVGNGRLDGRDGDPVWTFRLGAFEMTAECGSDGTLRYLHYFAV